MLKLTFIVPRYGPEILGGAEKHARDVAERLAARGHDVRVLTTCSSSYQTWANDVPARTTRIAGVEVVRFRTALRRLRPFDDVTKVLASALPGVASLGALWSVAQGPVCPRLLDRAAAEARERDALVFFSLLSWLTFEGLSRFGQKSALVPLVHEEPPIYTRLSRDTLRRPRALLVNTEEEAERIARVAGPAAAPTGIVAVGRETPPPPDPAFSLPSRAPDSIFGAPDRRAAPFAPSPYVVILGRLSKTRPMLPVWRELKRDGALPPLEWRGQLIPWRDVKLVTVGEQSRAYAEVPDVVPLDFVSDADRWQILHHAAALINPSVHESLSLVLLEAWSCRLPVVVNERCDVTVGQCRRAGGGVVADFAAPAKGARRIAEGLAREHDRRTMGQRGDAYVRRRYDWERVLDAYERIASAIARRAPITEALQPPDPAPDS